ncbi:glucosaminidase domain-containing protein [Motiliproteus sediminis]|uniref:glucosaminidase domain-containing protein n=1 Tax=Motiliproteus sediminis TaxID=1468178 RepID=UPI001AEFB1E1|nr:glucosaminidase domain-containing protein [Motiliproteus sediminis]
MIRYPATRPILAALTLVLAACQPSEPVRDGEPHYQRIGHAPALQPEFNDASLPDFSQITDVKTKKAEFFGFLEPLVAHQNNHLATLRTHLLKLDQAFVDQGGLHPDDLAWLQQMAELFRVDSAQPAEQLARLKRKVGQIPTAMVLAQAANESAWGTSRFAREGNNLFGMWCFRPGCGLAPLQRAEGATHEVAAYDSVEEGINRYLINLNANSSYRDMRAIRSCLRQQQKPLSGRALAAGLTGYSERGSHYVQELRAMMRINELEPWARPWWGNVDTDHPCYELVQVVIDQPDPILVADTPASDAAASVDAVSSLDAGLINDANAAASLATQAVSAATATDSTPVSAAVKAIAGNTLSGAVTAE